MQNDPSKAIPGVQAAEIAKAVQSLTKIPLTTVDDPRRFIVEVRAIAESRAQASWQAEGIDDVAVFVLATYPREVGQRFGAEPVSDLIATKDPILGRLFFLNRDASSGRGMKLPAAANAILEWLTSNNLDTLPVVVVHRSTMLMISRPDGANGETQRDIVRGKAPVATIAEIDTALNHSHKNWLLTPAVCPVGVWAAGRSSKYIPGPLPEKAIQRELGTALSSWFRGIVKVEFEDSTSIGRIDIRLLRPGSDLRFSYWAVLELKVVKSSHHAPGKKKAKVVALSENAEAIAEGVRQAYAFGKNRNAEAFLEIYDLRKKKPKDLLVHTTVTKALRKCSLKPPPCRIWPLYGSASDARKDGWN